MAIELVRWQDAHHFLDEPDEYPNDYIVETTGTVEVQGSWLLIAQEVLPGGGYRGVTRILRDSVVERIRLTSVRDTTVGEWKRGAEVPPSFYGVEDTID